MVKPGFTISKRDKGIKANSRNNLFLKPNEVQVGSVCWQSDGLSFFYYYSEGVITIDCMEKENNY